MYFYYKKKCIKANNELMRTFCLKKTKFFKILILKFINNINKRLANIKLEQRSIRR